MLFFFFIKKNKYLKSVAKRSEAIFSRIFSLRHHIQYNLFTGLIRYIWTRWIFLCTKNPTWCFVNLSKIIRKVLLKKPLENLKIYKSTFFELLWVVFAVACVCVCLCVCVCVCVCVFACFFFQFMSEIIR